MVYKNVDHFTEYV